MMTLLNIYHFFWGNQILIAGIIFIIWLIFKKQLETLFGNKYFRIFFVSLPAIIIFVRILRNDPFFLSDDFDHLNLVFANSYLQILQIVLSKTGIWLNHHIIFGFWLFKVIYDFFGTNIYPYVTIIFLLNLVNVFGLYLLSGEFIKKNYIRTLITFLFGFLYLLWISNIHELLGAGFLMFTFYTFLRWIKTKKGKYGFWSIVLYIFAVFSKEITFLVFPLMILTFIYIKKNRIEKQYLNILIPFFVTFVLYSLFYASTFLGYFDVSTSYKVGFNFTSINNNLFYYLKLFMPGISSIYTAAVIALIAVYLAALYFKEFWGLIFLFGFFVLLIPSLIFLNRVAPYYVYTPAIFLFLSFGKLIELFSRFLKKPILAILVIVLCLYIFSVDKVLKYNIHLIVFPWPNQTREQLLPLVAEIKAFEDGGGKSTQFKLEGDTAGNVFFHGADAVKPFLPKQEADLYSYSINLAENVLIVTKNEK